MSREIRYLKEVSGDFVEAYKYYESISPGLALGFDETFASAEGEIETGLVTHLVAFDHYHRVLLRRFPYTLYYRLHNETAVVVALLYNRHDPDVIRARLDARTSS